MVYFSESINEYAAVNWRIFSKQQYFDDKGLFISLVFSVPILLNCMLMVVSIACLVKSRADFNLKQSQGNIHSRFLI